MTSADANPATKPIHIVVGTPCFGGNVTHHYIMSLLNLQSACIARGIDLSFRLLGGDSLIPRARNTVVTEFIEEKTATHLLFIDADIGFLPEQVFTLIEADKDVVGAVYPIKGYDWDKIRADIIAGKKNIPSGTLTYVVEFLDPAKIVAVDGFAQVRYIGTGFMLIKRQVFERMAASYPELKFRDIHSMVNVDLTSEHRYAYFDCTIDQKTGVYLSEDYTFCKRWTEIGGEIWADLESKLTHVGPIAFQGNLMSVFN